MTLIFIKKWLNFKNIYIKLNSFVNLIENFIDMKIKFDGDHKMTSKWNKIWNKREKYFDYLSYEHTTDLLWNKTWNEYNIH